jgi:pimeloyl-ACP methyl ester carboxylesterase
MTTDTATSTRTGRTQQQQQQQPIVVKHRVVKVDGLDIFYREAGEQHERNLLLLHGFPTSSHMFRNLIPALADRYHLVAPDFPGFGQSSAPSVDQFKYTFANLATVIDHFTQAIGLPRYGLYVQDYGGPVGFRLAAAHPERVRALIVQNANAYEEGLGDGIAPLRNYGSNPSEENAAVLRGLLTIDATKFQYTHGAPDPTAISPDNWVIDSAYLNRPGNQEIQLALFRDYNDNVTQYPVWHRFLREHRPPTLVTWGKNDPFFTLAGVEALRRDVPDAEVHLLDGGHFVLEEQPAHIAELIRDFIIRRVERAAAR